MDTSSLPPPHDFAPTATWDRLRLRARLLRRLRRFFDQRGFLEVETPLLSAEAAIDRHLDPFPVTLFDDPRSPQSGRVMWLQTSPELAMKRLLAAGGQAIYQTARAFRGGERGRLHNPEFTIVEWYRVGDTYDAAMQRTAELTEELLGVDGVDRRSYREAFEQRLGLDPHACSDGRLMEAAAAAGLDAGGPAESPGERPWRRDDLLDLLLAEKVQPHLGRPRPTILYDFPASQAALARVRDGRPPVAERFELFADGVELANGYHELLDPGQLRDRWKEIAAQRQADGKYSLPGSRRLLAAMEHGLPACAGVALGLDRLAMVAAGAETIADVLAFPVDRA